jgi:hypothetical protein
MYGGYGNFRPRLALLPPSAEAAFLELLDLPQDLTQGSRIDVPLKATGRKPSTGLAALAASLNRLSSVRPRRLIGVFDFMPPWRCSAFMTANPRQDIQAVPRSAAFVSISAAGRDRGISSSDSGTVLARWATASRSVRSCVPSGASIDHRTGVAKHWGAAALLDAGLTGPSSPRLRSVTEVTAIFEAN